MLVSCDSRDTVKPGNNVPVESVVKQLDRPGAVDYREFAILLKNHSGLLLDVLVPWCLSITDRHFEGQYHPPMNGDIVDFTPPTPNPIRNMDTASPGTPAPLSKATGSDVANIVVDPHIKRLVAGLSC